MNIFQSFQFKYPPKQQVSLRHQLATRIWRGITDAKKDYPICQCCGRKTGEQLVENKCIRNSSQFSFLGPGIPLFFKFLKYSILLLVIMTLVFSIFGLYTNVAAQSCVKDVRCIETPFNSLSIINKKDSFELMRAQNYVVLAFVVICFILLQFCRYRLRKVQQEIDELNVSASDYSIILKRLPQNTQIQQISQMIKKGCKTKQSSDPRLIQQFNNNPTVSSIIMSYDLTQYYEQKCELMNKFQEKIENQKQQGKQIKIQQQPSKPKQPAYIAVVVFQDQESKNAFIQQPSFYQRVFSYFFTPFTPLSSFQIGDQKISIERAPEPEDILWQNARFTPCQRLKRKFALNFVSFLLLIGGGACQYGLALWQVKIQDTSSKALAGTAASLLVTITNLILQQFLIRSTKLQKLTTYSQQLQILTFKLIFQQFLNSGVFVVAANILASFNDQALQGNLAETITQIMILNALTFNLSNYLLHRYDIIGRVKRYIFVEKKLFFTTQLSANQLFELPKPDFTQKYSYIVKTLWLTAFYAPFVPIVVPISLIGLVINYFVQKILFSSSYSIANKISSTLSNSCVQCLQYIPLILSVGEFIIYIYFEKFLAKTPEDWLIPIYICLALSFTNLALPMKQFNELIQKCIQNLFNQKSETEKNGQQKVLDKVNYYQAMQKFQITYEMTNPAYETKRQARKDTFVQIGIKQFAQTMVRQQNMRGLFGFLGGPSKHQTHKQENQEQNLQYPENSLIVLKHNPIIKITGLQEDPVQQENNDSKFTRATNSSLMVRQMSKQSIQKDTGMSTHEKTSQQNGSLFDFLTHQPQKNEDLISKNSNGPQSGSGSTQNFRQTKKLPQISFKKNNLNKLPAIVEQNEQNEAKNLH